MSDGLLEIRRFDPLYAPLIASWVRSPEELFRLAPSTSWPISAAKVVGWAKPQDEPLLLFEAGESLPCGYAELNSLRGSQEHLWIGHVVVDPCMRNRGLGRQFIRLLAERAFFFPQARRLTMVVFPDNEPATHCYRSVGFSVSGHERHCFSPGGTEHRMCRMEINRAKWERSLVRSVAQ